ncbi:MAG: ATP-dependent Clp protease adaptor ClpS [Pseudomonadota bacterium]
MSAPSNQMRIKLTILDDKETPYPFVVDLLETVFGRASIDAQLIATTAHYYGEAECGLWPKSVADAIVAAAQEKIAEAGHPLALAREDAVEREVVGQGCCSSCGRPASQVKMMYRGKIGQVCEICILEGVQMLSGATSEASFTETHEVLDWHFEGMGQARIETSVRTFPLRMRADLQIAFDKLFTERAVRQLGVRSSYSYQTIEFADLWETGRSAKAIVPLQYTDLDIGEPEPRRCVGTALWLLGSQGEKHAVLVSQDEGMRGEPKVRVEIAALEGQAGAEIAAGYFKEIERVIDQAQSYRGKVLSLDVQDQWQGLAGGITVHRLAPVAREGVVLPEATLALLDRNVLAFAQHRDRLRALGLPAKKGLLFYGPPGTGKTHTIQYLAGSLPGHTTLLITSEQVGLLRAYMGLARLLQPAILVIEDADLIARNREDMQDPAAEVLLNKLLNEMDGLRQDAEIFFILTTNRPEQLEVALAGRPGRIDQAIEFPLPDAQGRAKLAALYSGGLEIAPSIREGLVARTQGASGAFIKELMRRIAQWVFERDPESSDVTEADVTAALDEMMFEGSALNLRLLGGAIGGS